jgi:hypothetical protein
VKRRRWIPPFERFAATGGILGKVERDEQGFRVGDTGLEPMTSAV